MYNYINERRTTPNRKEVNTMAKFLELFDGCAIKVETTAETPDDFLLTVPTRFHREHGKEFKYNGEWYPAFDLDFIEI